MLTERTAEPWVLAYEDIIIDLADWKSAGMAAYYCNASVRLEDAGQQIWVKEAQAHENNIGDCSLL